MYGRLSPKGVKMAWVVGVLGPLLATTSVPLFLNLLDAFSVISTITTDSIGVPFNTVV